MHEVHEVHEVHELLPPMGGKEIPERQLRPLSKVDDSEMKALYEQAIENAY